MEPQITDSHRIDTKSVKLDRVKLVEAAVSYRRWFVDARNKPSPSFTKAYTNFNILYEQISAIVTKTESKSISYGETVENFLVLLSSSLFTYTNKLFFSEDGSNSLFASTDHTAIAKQVWWIIKATHMYLIDGALHPVLGAGEESIQVGATMVTSTITVSDHQAVRIPNGTNSKYYREIEAILVFVTAFTQHASSLHLSKTDMLDLCRTAFRLCVDTSELALELPASVSTMLIDLSCGEIEAIELLNSIFSRFKHYDIEISRVFTMITLFVKNQISLCFFDEDYDSRVCNLPDSESTYRRGLLEMLKRVHPMIINLRSVYPPKYIDSELIDVILRTFLSHLASISITDTTLCIYLNTLAHIIKYCRGSYSSAANQTLVYLILGCEKSKPSVHSVARPSLSDITSRMDRVAMTARKNVLRANIHASSPISSPAISSSGGAGTDAKTSPSAVTGSISASLMPSDPLKLASSAAEQRMVPVSGKAFTLSTPVNSVEKAYDAAMRVSVVSPDSPLAQLEDSLQVMEIPSASASVKEQKSAVETPVALPSSPAKTIVESPKPLSPAPRTVPRPPMPKYSVTLTNDLYNYTPVWRYSGFLMHQMEALTHRDQPLDNFIYAINKESGTLVPILNFLSDTEHYHYQMYLPNLLKYITSLDHTYFSHPGHLSNVYKLVMACLHILQALLDVGFAMTIAELEQSVKTMISPVNNVSCGVLQGYSSPLPMLRKNNRCYVKTLEDVKNLTGNAHADTEKMDIFVEIGRKSMSNTIRRSHLSVTFPPEMSIHVGGLFSPEKNLKPASSTSLPGLNSGYNSMRISSPVPQQARERNPMLFVQEQSHSFLLDGTGTLRKEDLPGGALTSKDYHFQFVYMHSPLLHFALEAYSHLIRVSNYVLSFSTDELDETLISKDMQNRKHSEILLWIPLYRIEDIDPWMKYGLKIPLPLTLYRLRSFATNFQIKQTSIEQTLEKKKKKTSKRKADILSKALPGNRFTQSAIEGRMSSKYSMDSLQVSNISIVDMLNELADDNMLEKVPFYNDKASIQFNVLGSLLGMIKIGTEVMENLVLLDSTYADFRYNIPLGDLVMENWPFPIGKISCHFTLRSDGKNQEVDHPVYINASHTWDYLYSLTRHIVTRMEKNIMFKRTLNFGNFVMLTQTKGDEVAIQEALEHITERNARILCYLLGRKVQ